MIAITYNGVVEGILVLLQPSSQVVGDGSSVMDNGKMGIRIRSWVRLGKLSPLSQAVVHQLLTKGGICGFWEEGFLLEDGQEGHRLLKHVNALLQVHPKVNVGPVQTLPGAFIIYSSTSYSLTEHILLAPE